jgi:methylmalonyl-CoA mutase C-terminal domain/subunit
VDDKRVIVGGNIPAADIPALQALGVAGVFPSSSRFEEIAGFIRESMGISY